MGLFDNKKPLSRPNFRQALRKSDGRVPGTFSKKYSLKERTVVEKDLFGYRQYGSHISADDFKRGIQRLQKEKVRLKSFAQRKEVEHKINYLKRLDQGK